MFRHNLLLIYRNFRRFRGTFFINLTGLSTGLACVVLIYLWVNDELRVDKFNEHDSRLFRAMEHRVKADGIWTSPTTSGPLAESLAADMPEVEYTAATTSVNDYTLSIDDKNIKATGRFVGKDFFKMLTYDFIHGNKGQVFSDKNSIVISEALALKLFNTTENLIGKAVAFEHEAEFLVSGVFKSAPANASDQFEFAMAFEKFIEGKDWILNWGNTGTRTIVLLKPGVNVDAFNKKIADYVKVKTNNEITHRTLFLKGYSANYLYGKYENGVLMGGRITYVKLFSIIAVFILVIACINFMNLSTAKASRRIKEVGIKKAVGAGRRALIFQYMGESMLLSFLSLLLAILLVEVLLPQFNEITGKQLVINFNTEFTLSLIAITVFTGFIAGSYPALYLSGFNPAAVLKGKFNTSLGELWARKGLVVFQFALSVIFIVSVLVVYKQIEFVQSANLGYNKDNIIHFNREGKILEKEKFEAFLAEMRNIPGVINASSITHDMTGHNSGTSGVVWEGKDPEDRTEFENVTVNYEMMETLGITMTEGRTFSPTYGADSAAIIFNEAGIKFMGLTDPVGKVVKLWGKDMQIIGVAKDFHYESLHENFKPLFFRLSPDNTYYMMAKLSAGKEKETISRLEHLYQKFNPGFSFDYRFLDQDYQAQYVAEQRVAILSKYFAGLAVLISCLGLFGLAAFTAERRLKEIGIRKALGASELGIIFLLSGDFTKIVLTSIMIGLPVSYFITMYWLDSFAFKIPLAWWYFVVAGFAALIISWLTVGTQALRAARVNPTRCLRDE